VVVIAAISVHSLPRELVRLILFHFHDSLVIYTFCPPQPMPEDVYSQTTWVCLGGAEDAIVINVDGRGIWEGQYVEGYTGHLSGVGDLRIVSMGDLGLPTWTSTLQHHYPCQWTD